VKQIYHMMRADFLERTRRFSFLVTIAFAVLLGYVSLPPLGAGYTTLILGGWRGVYNSAWVGLVVALEAAFLFSLAGFYLVKNAVERDYLTGVGQIIATTPISRIRYTLGKAASNFVFLAALVGVMTVAAGGMQLLRGEEMHVELWALLAPFLFLAMPVMALVACLAVLFEMVPLLRGGVGNVVYFFLWTAGMGSTSITSTGDLFGAGKVITSLKAAVSALDPGYKGGMVVGFDFPGRVFDRFVWEGMHWTGGMALQRLTVVGVALLVGLLAAALFHRFDPSREGRLARRSRASRQNQDQETEATAGGAPAPVALTLTPLDRGATRGGRTYLTVLAAELRLILKGLSVWWYLVAFGLWAACLLAPMGVSRRILWALAWAWPMLRWSALGSREALHRTEQLIFAAPASLGRQFPAMWLSGVLLAMLTGSSMAVRFVLAGDWAGLAAWCVGALFIPTLALAAGVWTGSGKLFEILYVLLLYAGVGNGVLTFDFMGSIAETVTAGIPLYYLAATALLLAAATAGRRLQIRQ
jgi:hypothetical protein